MLVVSDQHDATCGIGESDEIDEGADQGWVKENGAYVHEWWEVEENVI